MKTCLMCKDPFTGKREDSKFCSNSCKAKHWEMKNNANLKGVSETPFTAKQIMPDNKPSPIKTGTKELDPFLNLVGDIQNGNNTALQSSDPKTTEIPLPQQYITQTIRENNFNYSIYNKQLTQCRNDITTIETGIKKLTDLIEEEKKNSGTGLYIATAGSGALIGYNLSAPKEDIVRFKQKKAKGKSIPKPQQENSGSRLFSAVLGGLLGLGLGKIMDVATEDSREQAKQVNIQKYEKQKTEHQYRLQILKTQEKELVTNLAKYPAFEIKEIRILNPAYSLALKHNEEQKKLKINNVSSLLNGINQDQLTKNKKEEFESDKISSMQKISEMKFQLLDFQGKWKDFFGQPQTNFFCVIHGMSGEGKSTFAMQFTKYLAERFGKVLYVSGEEGWASTFQKKITELGVSSVANAYGADIRSGQELLSEVPTNKFHFIVIDSLNNMGIDAEVMRQIRAKFKQSAIIAICQNTKDGKVRGSYEIMHDSDIIVKVADGIALTIKNRFKEKNMQFDVFEALRKKERPIIPIYRKKENDDSGMDSELRNTV